MRQESGSEELPSKEARARASKRETEGLELPKVGMALFRRNF